MELFQILKKNPENFDLYVYNLKKTINYFEDKNNKYSDTIYTKVALSSIFSFTIGFIISKYL